MKILITGSAGFIGFNLAKSLLANKKYKIIGIDNFDKYYDVNLKKKRNKILLKNKNYQFYKINISNKKKLEYIFKKNKLDFVFHLAAQAGVRYSITNPQKYMDSNYIGFFNIIECVKKYKLKRLFYASSSSVYGENKNYPLKENYEINPINIYALSKKSNEEISKVYSKYYKINCTGLRFFTVFGQWGRPDMMMMKFIDSYFKNKVFYLYNFGKHSRDFTYIDDTVEILKLLLSKNSKLNNNDIFNICSNKPQSLKKIIDFMKTKSINPKIKKISLQQADIIKTHGDNRKVLKITKFKKFKSFKFGLEQTINWYKNFMI
tara:strand:+ start:1860 stop:2816 length:957 start_codon:yes stop_codon:yes gene_type:complete